MEDWLNSTNYNKIGEYRKEAPKTIIFWVESIYYIGSILGGVCADEFSERLGRKGGLLMNNIFAFFAAIMFGFCKSANSWEMIIAGRFLTGCNTGLNAHLAPMYLSEIVPKILRKNIGGWYQVIISSSSFLLFQIMGLESILSTSLDWHILLALTGFPAIFQFFMLSFCPESPKYLLINQDKQIEAEKALSWLRGTSDVQAEMEAIRNEQNLVPAVSLREKLTKSAVVIPILLFILKMAEFFGLQAVFGRYGYLVFEVLLACLVFGIKMMIKR